MVNTSGVGTHSPGVMADRDVGAGFAEEFSGDDMTVTKIRFL
jgi:hypothetical protein